MFTYCSNAIKIIFLRKKGKGAITNEDHVSVMFLSNGHILPLPIGLIDWNDNGVYGMDNTRIVNAISVLKNEAADYREWKKKNG